MEQLSMFDASLKFPLTHEDVLSLYREYVYEGETADDVFTFSDIKKGKSYQFYGKKFFEHYPGNEKTARLGVPMLNAEGKKEFKKVGADVFGPDQLAAFLKQLKKYKQETFRNLITEEFACCNDFIACSNAKGCLHTEDPFYNGCYYRRNLEQGKIFYGVNKNI